MRCKKATIILICCQLLISFWFINHFIMQPIQILDLKPPDVEQNWRNLSRYQIGALAQLTKLYYLDTLRPPARSNMFSIVMWDNGPLLAQRFIPRGQVDCPVTNCKVTYSKAHIVDADVVVFPLKALSHRSKLPKVRNTNQIWIAMTEDPPTRMFPQRPIDFIRNFDGVFNWTMSYRLNSDIVVPFGRTLVQEVDEHFDLNKYKRSSLSGTQIVTSPDNCKTLQTSILRNLISYLKIDIFGHCNPNAFTTKRTQDYSPLFNYIFYLVLDEDVCSEYYTHQVWWFAFEHNLIPIIICDVTREFPRILPPHSYINLLKFSSLKEMAVFFGSLLDETHQYLRYFEWRKNFRIVNEHGHFGTTNVHYCRLCEALNYNNLSPKVYTHLSSHWNASNECIAPPNWIIHPYV